MKCSYDVVFIYQTRCEQSGMSVGLRAFLRNCSLKHMNFLLILITVLLNIIMAIAMSVCIVKVHVNLYSNFFCFIFIVMVSMIPPFPN